MKNQFGKRCRLFSTVTAILLLSAVFGFSYAGVNDFRDGLSARPAEVASRLPAPNRLRAPSQLAPGKLLVAAQSMPDPRFRETVILLTRYDAEGAMGLVINRPTEIKLTSLFPHIESIQDTTHTVFLGGPVAKKQLFLLIRSISRPDRSEHVFGNVYLSSSMAILKELLADEKNRDSLRIYSGYSGWTRGQLDRELAKGEWHVTEADEKLIFEKDPSVIWQELILPSSVIHVKR